jgi:hypothetical protein
VAVGTSRGSVRLPGRLEPSSSSPPPQAAISAAMEIVRTRVTGRYRGVISSPEC